MYIHLIIFIIFLTNVYAFEETAIIWNKIDIHKVNQRVSDFLTNQKLYNCFEYQENSNHLLLKCWRNDKIINADIYVYAHDDYAHDDFIFI